MVNTMRAVDVMRRNVATVPPDLTVDELDRFLSGRGIFGAPVVQGEHVVGVVSGAEILRAIGPADGEDGVASDFYTELVGEFPKGGMVPRDGSGRAADLRVRDIMTTSLIVVPPDQSVRDIARGLLAGGVHRVLVTEGRRLLGLVTTLDLVRVISDSRFAKPWAA
ncbi:MAG: CBS domain-containing protein [Deltaproteobacteria bacterium]|jgi:CBS domain-containing protein